MQKISGKSDVYAIIGYPVKHSFSPLMHNSAFEALNIDAVYVPFEIAPEDLEKAVIGMKLIGIKGFNVTIPHKEEVVKYLDILDETAINAGAVNVVKNENGKLTGFNSDGAGLLRSLKLQFGFDPKGKSCIIAGAGGAARGAVAALASAGISKITILNRTRSKSEKLIEFIQSKFSELEMVSEDYPFLDSCKKIEADLFINTTSLGMHGEEIPNLNLSLFDKNCIVYDMVYSKNKTPLLISAEKNLLRNANGLGMLAGQGEIAFKIWRKVEPTEGLMLKVLG